MKVFWSWQSDTPGKVGRHFVRECLEKAIQQLKEEADIEEAERDDLNELHLDHDRKSVPGSPDLARTIFQKIDAATVFVGDVSLTGASDNGAKRIINANVAIELGYSLKVLTDERLIMVMNEAFGGREHLPFDLAHKAGPIMFSLKEDADAETTKAAATQLTGHLKVSLRDILNSARVADATHSQSALPKNSVVPLAQDEDATSPFVGSERIVRLHAPYGRELISDVFWTAGPHLFIRLLPLEAPSPLLRIPKLIDGFRQGRPSIIGGWAAVNWGANEKGAALLSVQQSEKQITTRNFTQISRYGELWSVDGDCFSKKDNAVWFVEPIFIQALEGFLRFLRGQTLVRGPAKLIAGMESVQDVRMVLPEPPAGRHWPRGPFTLGCTQKRIIWKTQIDIGTAASSAALFNEFFQEIWDAFQWQRPEWLANL